MKKIQSISNVIGSFVNLPHNPFLRNLFFCQDFLKIYFSKEHQMLISRIFIKNNILHILTKSNVARQEFNHDSTKNEIKFRIKKYANMYKDSPFKYIKDIKILSIKFNDKTKIAYKPLPKAPYIELSLAKFENNFKNPIFYQKMEELRQIIKKNINE